MPRAFLSALVGPLLILCCLWAGPARALPDDTMEHVVSVLPVWPGHAQGGSGGRPGEAPEGSGVVIRDGVIATAWHVVEPARRIDVRLSDGRILPARLMARDPVSDIALLEVDLPLAPIEIAPPPSLAQPVCAIGNAFGLGLSVSCGVVSATGVSNAGFNAVEDFVQTDAAANPGTSGGALVDMDGRLVGMVSAIFASGADTNIGVNFAVSTALLTRVAHSLMTAGDVRYPKPGWRLGAADREVLAQIAAPAIRSVLSTGPAAAAGLQEGDLIVTVGDRRVHSPRDVVTALALLPDNQSEVPLGIRRGDNEQTIQLSLAPPEPTQRPEAASVPQSDCPHPEAVCRLRQAVFPVSSFDPVGSATRIGPDLLVTNRHVVGPLTEATVHTPEGPRQARLVPSAYSGDLVLLQTEGLPETGVVPDLDGSGSIDGPFYVIGADIARKEVRVFTPGDLIANPADTADLGRLHVTAQMQPGVSGGALTDESGALAGIAVGGGDGRFEAMPVADIRKLLALRDDDDAIRVTEQLGADFLACEEVMESASAGPARAEALDQLAETCSRSTNHGQLLKAGRLLAQAGAFEGAIRLHGDATTQVPNSINSRMSLLVSLQLAGRFEEMTAHARRLMELAPDDPQALRFSIQSGVWGDDPDLAEDGYQALLKADPRQAQAARRFIDNAPPAPPRR